MNKHKKGNIKKKNINLLLTGILVHPAERIRSFLIGYLVKIYNGQSWEVFRVTEFMLGHFFGEFLRTKKLGSKIHIKIKKKKK